MNQLKKAELENRLLIIDEIGYLNLDSEDANLFFQLITLRYEKKSTVITTNKSLSKWCEYRWTIIPDKGCSREA